MSVPPLTSTTAKPPHSQQDKVPTLHTPCDPLVKSQSRDVFERLTVSRASTRHQTPLGMTRSKEKSGKGKDGIETMGHKVIRTQAKIRMMREKMEAERLQEMREYPKISEKSKELAEKADEKFFSRFNIRPRLNSSGRVKAQRLDGPQNLTELSPESEKVAVPQHATTPSHVSTALKAQMDFLEPEDSAPAASSAIKSGLRDRIRQYLQTAPKPASLPQAETLLDPSQSSNLNTTLPGNNAGHPSRGRTYSYNYGGNSELSNLRIPGKGGIRPVSQKRRGALGNTLSPVVRQVSYGAGCDWDALLARKKSVQ